MHLRWDYEGRKVHLAMPGYVHKALKEFQHETPKRKPNSPYPCAQKKYGKEAQLVDKVLQLQTLSKSEQKFTHKVTGKFLYSERDVGSTLQTPLSAIASQQAAPTTQTMQNTL